MASGRHLAISFRDARGKVGRSNYYIGGVDIAALGAADNALQAAVAALTLAHVYGTSINHNSEAVIYGGSSGGYPDVEDKLVMVFQTADGSLHRYATPAPKFSDLENDGETAAVGATDVANYIAAVLGNVTSRSGEQMTVCLGGYRRRSATIRRFNVITRNPMLSGEGL